MTLSIHKIQLPLKFPIDAAHGELLERPTILLELSIDGQTFWSEAPGFLGDSYMPETHDLLWHELCSRAPELLRAFKDQHVDLFLTSLIDQPILKYAIDGLFCQYDAALNNQSLMAYLGISERPVLGSAMIGIQPTAALYNARMDAVSNMNYEAIKFKLSPAVLPTLIPILSQAVKTFDYVCVDANGSFGHSNAMDLNAIPATVAIEQPTHDTDLLMQLLTQLPQQVLLDESVRSIQDLYQFKGVGVGVMLKPVCLGGLRHTIKMIYTCYELGIPCGISGYLDSGVGRYFQWLIAQHSKCLLRADFVWSDYYFDRDVFNVHASLTPHTDLTIDIDDFRPVSRQFSL